jgi:phosphate transport system permease protein
MSAAATKREPMSPTIVRDLERWRSQSSTSPVERVVSTLLFGCAAVSVMTTAGIILVLLVETVGFFREVSPVAFLTDTQWTPLFADKHFGIWPLLSGTVLTTVIAVAFALPFGLLSAILLSEYVHPRARRILKPLLEVLAGVPTVVYGYFALNAVTPMLQRIIPGLGGFNALSAGLVMGVMILPIIASLSEDALRAVPRESRDASLALGATKLTTVWRTLVPAAYSGIAASVMLAISRAIGETMIVAIAAGEQPRFGLDPRVPTETMTAYIAQVSLGDTPAGTLEYRTIFAVGSSLLVMTLVVNLVSFRLKRRMQRP